MLTGTMKLTGALLLTACASLPNYSQERTLSNKGETLAIYGLEWQIPRGIHIGIWSDVQWCMGLDMDEGLDPVTELRWGTALALVDEGDSTLAYGVAIQEGELGPSIIIEQDYWLHPEVISHEVVHILLGGGEEEELPYRCIMSFAGSNLPLRRAPMELLNNPGAGHQ